MTRKDQALYDDVVAHPAVPTRHPLNCARRLRLTELAVRVLAHESPRLRVVSLGNPSYHVVEVVDNR